MKTRLLISLLSIFLGMKLSALEIPKNLSETDRESAAKILGIGSSSKMLSNPYPLGGYLGFEVGFSLEVINVEDLSRLGNQTDLQKDFMLPRLSFGKGLFGNLDLQLYFSPYAATSGTNNYGGSLRFTAYEAQFIPLTLSFLGYAGAFNVADVYSSFNTGVDAVFGINSNHLALYFGFGRVQTESRFLAVGTNAVTTSPSGDSLVFTKLGTNHSMAGIHIEVAPLFIAAQIDRYEDSVFSGKIGMRF